MRKQRPKLELALAYEGTTVIQEVALDISNLAKVVSDDQR
jgi:hypothetical protein